jgi:hypothetical protein
VCVWGGRSVCVGLVKKNLEEKNRQQLKRKVSTRAVSIGLSG